jgi:hypothetical protein
MLVVNQDSSHNQVTYKVRIANEVFQKKEGKNGRWRGVTWAMFYIVQVENSIYKNDLLLKELGQIIKARD